MTSLGSGTELSSPFGMRPADSSKPHEPEWAESWERALLGLDEN
jgi:hypothetical protein